jgi:aspartyl-tRNA(Asn)/glutamyl-tRNA(Gln) amidotransferase subunit A
LPACQVFRCQPACQSDGLPLGLQVIGKALDESACFRVGGELERAAGFVARPEKWW